MAHDEMAVLEDQMRRANPFPSLDEVAESDASSLVSAIVGEITGVDLVRVPVRQDPSSTSSQASSRTINVVPTWWERWFAGGSTRVAARPAWSAAVVAFLAVMLVGAALLVMSPFRSRLPATQVSTTVEVTSTTTAPTTTLAVTPMSTVVPDAPELKASDLVEVERVTDESLNEFGMRIWDVAVGGPGLVAVGEVSTPDDVLPNSTRPSMDAVVLVSPDGRDWRRVDDPGLFGGEGWDELHAIWSSPTGLIAQGRDAEAKHPDLSWYASVDGVDWTLITDEDLYDMWERERLSGDTWIEFLEGGPGWVAALYSDVGGSEPSVNATMGCVDYPSRECENPSLRGILVSPDGIHWESTVEPLDTLVAPESQPPPRPEPAAWGSGDSYYPWRLAWDNDQVVAVRYHAQPKVGISADGGETWLQVDPNSFGNDSLVTTIDVIRFGDSYVISGNTFDSAAVWILRWKDPN